MAEIKDLDETLIMDQVGKALSPDPDDAAPKRVGHYDLKREIGRGALSVVYEAEDTHTGQEVALKMLMLSSSLSPLEAEALIARFEREARTAAQLSHPNIVHIYKVGAEGNQHYLAMEYLKGQTLRKRMGEGTVTTTEVFAILTQIAGALDAVHRAGIVHRDVKPTNIILLPDGTAKLLDFGIARSSRETAITHRGMIVGSPSYMAPEQIKGDAGTKATDIWALGVLSYEMLTGYLPFTGQNVGGVMFQIMHEAPAPMPDLPPSVQKVLLRALDKRPSQRYSTASALAQALKLAYPKQAPVAPEQKPAAAPEPAVSPKPVKFPKPAASFSLPGPKWLPEAALLGLFLLGFSGAYLVRSHTESHLQKTAASSTAARSLDQTPAPTSVQSSASARASAPAHVLQTPQPQEISPDVPPVPDPAPALAHSALTVAHSAPAVPLPAQAEPQDQQAVLPRTRMLVAQKTSITRAKQAAALTKPAITEPAHIAQTVVSVPVQPRRSAVNATPVPSRPAPIQVASRHLAVPTIAPQLVPRSDRSEPEQAPAKPAPAPSAAPPVSAQKTIQAATLPSEGDSYDPEAEARHRKAAWSQQGNSSQP